MSEDPATLDVTTALNQIEQAASEGHLSDGAVENLRHWLTEERYADYLPSVLRHIAERKWQALDDAFWTVIPFGTGGRRGRMYEIGSNTINDRTIGESAQGLADYVKQHRTGSGPLSCAIAYDTRHNSPHFARLCARSWSPPDSRFTSWTIIAVLLSCRSWSGTNDVVVESW